MNLHSKTIPTLTVMLSLTLAPGWLLAQTIRPNQKIRPISKIKGPVRISVIGSTVDVQELENTELAVCNSADHCDRLESYTNQAFIALRQLRPARHLRVELDCSERHRWSLAGLDPALLGRHGARAGEFG